MRSIIFVFVLLTSSSIFSQIGVNRENPEATLDIEARSNEGNNPEGVLIPRISRERAQNMTGVRTSTLVYINDISNGDTTGKAKNIDAEGFYYFKDGKWIKVGATGNFWSLKGNKEITSPTIDKASANYEISNLNDADFIGTTDGKNVIMATNKFARLEIGDIKNQAVQGNTFSFVLDVFGKARFRKGIVTAASNYPDYVFEKYLTGKSNENPDYRFRKLNEVEAFIKEHKHLPGVTSIKDLNKSEEGYEIDNTQLSIQTLEKVEELYLYIIEQQKQIDTLKAEIVRLKK